MSRSGAAIRSPVIESALQNELMRWLAHHHKQLFEDEQNGWYTDPKLWPRDRSLKVLQEWCSFELHTVVVDAGETPLEDDDDDVPGGGRRPD